MIDVPEEYGGAELGLLTSSLVGSELREASFSVAFGAHTTIGTLPIVFYGNEEQKRKYLPKLASGEWIAAYALTEPGVGSDAMGLTTRAELSEDGKHYILNGTKQWISNAGFADVMIAFARIGNEKPSAFIVEANWPGVSTGAEERKMGIKGSSTRQVYFEDTKVPVENLLGEIHKGYKIAFNILNIGRLKLGAGTVGGARSALGLAATYTTERKAFGQYLYSFGMIKKKLARMAAETYAAESEVFRTAANIEQARHSASDTEEAFKAIEEYAVECSVLKVWGSEMLDQVVDEVVQIYGGYGFVEEYPAERAYRDARVNRIFEGTNEINRMITTGWMLKQAMSGKLALMPAIKKLMDEVLAGPSMADPLEGPLAAERTLVINAKKIALFVAGAASQKYMMALPDQQEIMGAMADILIETFAMESAVLRTQKLTAANGEAAAKLATAMTQVYLTDSFNKLEACAKKVIAAIAEGDMLRTQMAILRRLAKHEPVNVIALRQTIADRVLEAGKYVTV